jgi:hypothetical protein
MVASRTERKGRGEMKPRGGKENRKKGLKKYGKKERKRERERESS